MDTITLDLLRGAVSNRICAFECATIKQGPGVTSVYRARLQYAGGEQAHHPSSVVIKLTAHVDASGALSPDREYRFYTQIGPRLSIPSAKLYYAGVDPATQARMLVLEDLEPRYIFHPPDQEWLMDEVSCILRAYAALHAHGAAILREMPDRDWLLAHFAVPPRAEDLLRQTRDLVAQEIWEPVNGLERMIELSIAHCADLQAGASTLLHNDIYPPNLALPRNLHEQAIIIDWEMLGYGAAEMDLAYLFMQPFRNARHVQRADALAYYWDQRAAHGDTPPPAQERAERIHWAERCLLLWFIPLAHKAAANPYPAGTQARRFWDAMLAVLAERLQQAHDE